MKAFVLAAGLGTRLKPWTLEHPKALVPVGGIPMLERVLCRLRDEGFNEVTVNVHHFAGQVRDFVTSRDWGIHLSISDESDELLDTGGAILKASPMLCCDDRPFLVHNVDILSDAPLRSIMDMHMATGRDVSLVTSGRESSRRLLFDADGNLCGWHNISTGEYRPARLFSGIDMAEHAFSGIYIVRAGVMASLWEYSSAIGSARFPVMDFFLNMAATDKINIGEIWLDKLNLIDIGKPETLLRAESLFKSVKDDCQ